MKSRYNHEIRTADEPLKGFFAVPAIDCRSPLDQGIIRAIKLHFSSTADSGHSS